MLQADHQAAAGSSPVGAGIPGRVVIVGGGLSAWLSAALLQRSAGRLGCRITVIDFPVTDECRTAETTLPSVIGLLQNLGVEENDVLRYCHATYRLATQYADWVRTERDFWLPLGSDRQRIDNRELFHSWNAERSAGRLLRPLHTYSLHWGAALAGRSPHAFSGSSPISASATYGLHLDSQAFTDWLRELAMANAVEVYTDTIASVAANRHGGIAQIQLTSGATVTGDFFLDCTGESALLADEFLRDPLISWQEQLLCNRRISIRLSGGRQVSSATKVTALTSGWSWQIPLARQMDLGYCYSSLFVSDQDAWTQLQAAVPMTLRNQLPLNVPQPNTLFSGRRTQFWRDNVLALGTAAVCLEPLASTALHLCQTGIELFLEMFPDHAGNAACRDYYNERMGGLADQARDFVQLHYLLSHRDDSPFWIAASQTRPSSELKQRLDIYDLVGAIDGLFPEAFQTADYYQLLSGCGRLPQHPSVLTNTADPSHRQQQLRQILQQNEQALKDLPLHEELLDWIHLTPVAAQELQ